MLNFGHLAFVTPWLLGFLAALPVLWWLLRLTPPAPKKILFPALALLKGLMGREETPAHTPWWLLLLRLLIVTLLIIGLAKPVLDPIAATNNNGNLLIVVDNDWAAARDWSAQQDILRDILHNAEHNHRQIYLLTTTSTASNDLPNSNGPMAAEAALSRIDPLAPEAWPADWGAATKLLGDVKSVDEVVWLASGVGSVDAKIFYDALARIAPVKVFTTDQPIYTLQTPANEGDAWSIAVQRAATDLSADVGVEALTKDGRGLAHWTAHFAEGSPRAIVPLPMPGEVRNQIARFEIEAPRTAASTLLLDAAWEHRTVGIVGDAAELDRHYLLSEIYYIDRALKPFADLQIAALDVLIKAKAPVIVVTDTAVIADDVLPSLENWMKQGGVLVRFAGDHFAAADHTKETSLLPVILRDGDRSLGGALTWGAPQTLQVFPATSPFRNLVVPADVTVKRQVLAEPVADLITKTWAALADGTPLVTAATKGQGLTILFHVPAVSSWSNLPLSGLFVEMLQKIVVLSRNDHAADAAHLSALVPLRILDAKGDEHAPGSSVQPIDDADGATLSKISPVHPPGLYGTDTDNMALNLGVEIGQPQALRDIPVETYRAHGTEIDLQPYMLLAALLLLLVDFLLSLKMRGLLKMTLCVFLVVGSAQPAMANNDSLRAELTSKLYLAYVLSGDAAIDNVTEAGLRGLAAMVQSRTSIDHVGVAKVDPNSDELAFYPIIYWPVTAQAPPLTPEGAKRVNYYLRHSGMILFDAVEGDASSPMFMRRILAGVDMPPLVRLPENHVLKRTFYLLDDFPGRFAENDFWIEPEESSATDGVASVMYGSNGWAQAWAMDNAGHPLYPCTPNGEAQRERAYRFGVNLVIYALTGNYKNDQLQTSALLEKMKR